MFKRIRKLLVSVLVPAMLGAMSIPAGAVPAFGAETEPLSVTIPVEISVSGSNIPADKEYTLVIEGLDNAPMPESSTLTIKNGGSASFGPIRYTVPEDYHYRIRQTTEAQENFTYDTAVYNVTVQVVNAENGKLSATVVGGREGSTEKSQSLVFNNSYTAPGGGNENGGGGGGSNGGGGGGRTDLTTDDTVTITDSGTPTAQIGEGEVPLSPGDVIDQIVDTLVPLAVLPKTGDGSLSCGVLLAVLIVSGGLAGGLYWKRKKNENAAE